MRQILSQPPPRRAADSYASGNRDSRTGSRLGSSTSPSGASRRFRSAGAPRFLRYRRRESFCRRRSRRLPDALPLRPAAPEDALPRCRLEGREGIAFLKSERFPDARFRDFAQPVEIDDVDPRRNCVAISNGTCAAITCGDARAGIADCTCAVTFLDGGVAAGSDVPSWPRRHGRRVARRLRKRQPGGKNQSGRSNHDMATYATLWLPPRSYKENARVIPKENARVTPSIAEGPAFCRHSRKLTHAHRVFFFGRAFRAFGYACFSELRLFFRQRTDYREHPSLAVVSLVHQH